MSSVFLPFLNPPSQWRNVAPVAPLSPGGDKISNSSYLAANMYHTSAKLTFGVEEILGYKKLQGAPKTFNGRKTPIRKTEKIVATFLFFLFFRSKIANRSHINKKAIASHS